MSPSRPLILASTSVYRRELLSRLQLPFAVHAPDVDESPLPGEAPPALAQRLALAKAQVLAGRFPQAVVIGSDQVADLHGQPIGKPGSRERARDQLRLMRGQTLCFHTAVAVVCQESGYLGEAKAEVEVLVRALTDVEIERYLDLEPAWDCAGSAKSEGLGICLMASIRSDDPSALVGLPLIHTAALLRAAGIDPLSAPVATAR